MSGPEERRARRFPHFGSKRHREIDEELETHLALRVDDLVEAGMDPISARREAERRLDARRGDAAAARARLRRSARWRDLRRAAPRLLGGLTRDARLALRRIRAEPGFTLLEVAIVALGVGLATGTYTLVDRVLLRPLPLPQPERLVALHGKDSTGTAVPFVSATNHADWEGASTLEASGLHGYPSEYIVTIADGERRRVPGQTVAGEFFRTVRMPLVTGRYPDPADVEAASSGSSAYDGVVVSESFWRDALDSSPLPGPTFLQDGRRLRVVGVVRDEAAYPPPAGHLWIPVPRGPLDEGARNWINWYAVGRLAPGATVRAAETELSSRTVAAHRAGSGSLYTYGAQVEPLRDFVVGEDVPRILWLLLAAVGLVLATAVLNLAGLGLARAMARRRDAAVRLALGAKRARLVREGVVRSVVVALVGGTLGVGLASALMKVALRQAGSPLPRGAEIAVDGRIAAVGLLLTLGAGIGAGLLPSLRASAGALRPLLGPTGAPRERRARPGSGLSGRTPGAVLVAMEIGLSVLILSTTAVTLQSFRGLLDRELGFEPSGVVSARVWMRDSTLFDVDARRQAWEGAADAARAIPGVRSATISYSVPTQRRLATSFLHDADRGPLPGAVGVSVVGEGYFETLGIPVLEGREFDEGDAIGSEPVAVISRSVAARHWPAGTPLGARIRTPSLASDRASEAPWMTVIGVVGDVRRYGHESDVSQEVYAPFRQVPRLPFDAEVSVRTAADPGPLKPALENALEALPHRPVVEARLMNDLVAERLSRRRLVLAVLSVFGILGPVLAGLGLYGLVTFSVSRRTRELGIRAALGARSADVVGLVLRGALSVTMVGLTGGLIASWWVRDLVRSLLVAAETPAPSAYVFGATLVVAVAAAATLAPAVRAARMDPREALGAS